MNYWRQVFNVLFQDLVLKMPDFPFCALLLLRLVFVTDAREVTVSNLVCLLDFSEALQKKSCKITTVVSNYIGSPTLWQLGNLTSG